MCVSDKSAQHRINNEGLQQWPAARQHLPQRLTPARAVIAAICGAALLGRVRQPLPGRGKLLSLFIVATGVVAGDPLLSALALQQIPLAQSIVCDSRQPLATALLGVSRAGYRTKPLLRVLSCPGSARCRGLRVKTQPGRSDIEAVRLHPLLRASGWTRRVSAEATVCDW